MYSLITNVLKGKKGAATHFYKSNYKIVRKYLIVKLPSASDTDEILQDVFLSAFDSLPLFRAESSVKTWLLAIARHEVADYYRKRYIRIAVEKTSKLFDSLSRESETPEYVYQKEQIRRRYDQAIGSLSRRYGQVIYLKYEVGMSVAEISEKIGSSLKATESLLYRARMAFVVAYDKV